MLKRMLLALLSMALLLSAACASAETPNLSQMTFEKLADLRAQIDAEMQSRPEAEDIILPGGGEYVVGEDLLPGTYYFIYSDTSTGNISVEVYTDKSAERAESYINCNSDDYLVHALSLEEGNCIRTRWTIRLNRVGFPDYHVPEGTYIPAGNYVIGTDIPAGRYEINLYESRSVVEVKNAHGIREFYMVLDGAERTAIVTLNEDATLVIQKGGIMMNKSNTKFTFD